MSFANGTIGEIIKALDISSVEMLAISLPESRIVDATRCLMQRCACNKYEMIGKQLSQSRSSAFFARYIDEGLTGVSTQASTKIEVTYRPAGGHPVSARFKPQHVRDDEREYLLLINPAQPQQGASNDDEIQARLEMAVRAGGYGSWAYDFRTGEHSISPELYRILGYEIDDQRLQFADFEEMVHPDDRDRTLGAAIKRDPEASHWRTRFRYKAADEKYLWLEQSAAVIRDPLTAVNAKVIGLIRDVTERMNEVHRIETSEHNLARSQEIAGIGSWVINCASGEAEWSAQLYRLFGLKAGPGQPTFEPVFDMMDAAHRNRWKGHVERARRGAAGKPVVCEFNHPSGETRRIELHIYSEPGQNGRIVALHGICRDITEQNLLERKFLQAQKMESVGRLTGGISHDFNNLLMVIIGNLQLIEHLVKDDQNALTRVRTAIDAANKGSELTKRMLAFSREQTLEDEEIKINDLIRSMSDMITRAIGGNIDLQIKLGPFLWNIATDKTQLETAVLNLCINARDAMKAGGQLTVETENVELDQAECNEFDGLKPGRFVKVSVTDTGHGMPADIIEKVTEPFFTTKGPDAGSGLGLAMIFGFVKQSGGHLLIESQENVGTTMTIYLPAIESDASSATPKDRPAQPKATQPTADSDDPPDAPCAPAPAPQAAEQQDQPTPPKPGEAGTKTVLVVEDNHAVRDVAIAMIEDLGYIVLEAANGEDGLELIKQHPEIDLLLSDVLMPGMNGPALAAEAMKIRPDLKVVFASGYTQGASEDMHELPNFIELVNKPFTREELTAKVKGAIETSQAA